MRDGALLGMGVAAVLDGVVLHQLLHWHHFYARGSQAAALVSDGLFHLLATGLLLAGALAVRARPPAPGQRGRFWAALALGAGAFNLFDGFIDHKLLRVHQVREGVADVLPYDIAFDGLAAALVLGGVLGLRRPMRASSPASAAGARDES